MIDCSHGNSLKDHRKQADVAASICEQVASGSWQIFGAMLESHLVEGRQDYVPGRTAIYGQSITDACISLEQTDRCSSNSRRLSRPGAPGGAENLSTPSSRLRNFQFPTPQHPNSATPN